MNVVLILGSRVALVNIMRHLFGGGGFNTVLPVALLIHTFETSVSYG